MALKILLWFARILAILSILFMLMFSLDVFEENIPFAKQLLAFLKHNIPGFALIIALIVSWKNEIVGGIIYIVLFAALGKFWGSFSGNTGSLILITPFLLVGILLILHSVLIARKKKGGYDGS